MILLVIISWLTGAVLAQRFKIMILIPAVAPVIGAATAMGVAQAHPVWWILVMAGAACASMQVGYFLGLSIRHFLEAPLAQRPAPFRPDASARHSLH
jgi:hypothetical protein